MIPTEEELQRLAVEAKPNYPAILPAWRDGYEQALRDHYLPAMREVVGLRDALKVLLAHCTTSHLCYPDCIEFARAALSPQHPLPMSDNTDPLLTQNQIDQIHDIWDDAKLRILAIQFLADFREGKLTMEETVNLIMQMRDGDARRKDRAALQAAADALAKAATTIDKETTSDKANRVHMEVHAALSLLSDLGITPKKDTA